jgi:hypothetical protein
MLLLAANAHATSGYRVYPGGVELTLPVERSDGHVTSVSADGTGRVKVKLEEASSALEVSTTGRVSSQRIAASFGAFGRIDVRLRMNQPQWNPPHTGRCHGTGSLYQEGIYRGTISFSPMQGVPEISTTSGQVYYERRFRQVCRRRRPRPISSPHAKLERRLEEADLTVHGKADGRTVRLHATIFAFRRSPAYSAGTVQATAYERRGAVRITRRIGKTFGRHQFVMSRRGEDPETVKVQLPTPFAGQASYSRGANALPSWTGNLSVDMPGAAGVALAGVGFSAVLCRGKVAGCRYGNGSTSDP